MKRKLFALLTALFLLATLPGATLAAENPSYVIDGAGLLTPDQRDALEEKALTLRDDYEMDIVILTVDSLDDSTPQSYADDYYDAHSYGYGEDDSGMLFLLSMENRDWYISTYGDAIYALTDYAIQASAEDAISYFRDGDYFGGFNAWLNALPTYLSAYQSGAPMDGYADYSGDYYHGDREETVYYEEASSPNFFLSLLIGLGVAAVAVLIMRSQMKTNVSQSDASNYLKSGSFHLRTQQDIFLYSNLTKTARPKETSSPGGSGGGSSVHHSSSGRSHGGGGGKF